MKAVRQTAKPVSIMMVILMLLLVVPYQTALAGMVGTETVLEVARGDEARIYLNQVLAREDMQTALIAQGIDPLEAEARVNSLSNAEVVRLAEQIEQLPAGGLTGVDVVVSACIILVFVLFIIGVLDAL
jgi:hypothetical protein